MTTQVQEGQAPSTIGQPPRVWPVWISFVVGAVGVGAFIPPLIASLVQAGKAKALGFTWPQRRKYWWPTWISLGFTVLTIALLFVATQAMNSAIKAGTTPGDANLPATAQTAPAVPAAANPTKCTYAFNQDNEPQTLTGSTLKGIVFQLATLRQHAIANHDANCLAVVYGSNRAAINRDLQMDSPSEISFQLTGLSFPESKSYTGQQFTFRYQLQTATGGAQSYVYSARLARRGNLWQFASLDPVTS